MARPEIVTNKHLEYLDDLRESDETNMYGAGSYLQRTFSVTVKESRDILRYWMDSFGNPAR